MGKVFATTSGKGGVGKSTVAVGLALTFARSGKKTLLVDMDEGLRCLDLLLGVDDSAILDLCDILSGCDIEDAVYNCKTENLFLIPAPTSVGKIDPTLFKEFAAQVEKLYDTVIFDFPAGLDFSLYTLLPKNTVFLNIAVCDPVSVRDAAAAGKTLLDLGLNARLIINRFSYKQNLHRKHKTIDGVIDSSYLRLLGIVPESDELNALSITHKIKKRGRAAKAFGRICKRLCGEMLPLENIKKI